jgi:hypothetical protein
VLLRLDDLHLDVFSNVLTRLKDFFGDGNLQFLSVERQWLIEIPRVEDGRFWFDRERRARPGGGRDRRHVLEIVFAASSSCLRLRYISPWHFAIAFGRVKLNCRTIPVPALVA